MKQNDRIHENEHSKEHLLDIDYIQTKIDEGFKYTKMAKNQSLVLVIGNTGAGKSTTCNYLLGHEMYEDDSDLNVKVNGTTSVEIGFTQESHTLYAQPIIDEKFDQPWLLTDCPGFRGNRREEESIIESISIELAIRKAVQVKGIMILIPYYHVKDKKASEFRGLLRTLISLFKNPIGMMKYSVFGITHLGGEPRDRINKQLWISIKNLRDYCQNQIKKLGGTQSKSSEGMTIDEYQQVYDYFGELEKEKDRVFLVDPLDNGQSKKLILEKINNLKLRKGFRQKIGEGIKNLLSENDQNEGEPLPITNADFNFDGYDPHRHKFNEAMYDRAFDGDEETTKIEGTVKKLQETISILEGAKERLRIFQELKFNMENTSSNDISVIKDKAKKQIKLWEKVVEANNSNIEKKQDRIDRKKDHKQKDSNFFDEFFGHSGSACINEELEKLNKENEAINNDKPCLFQKKDWDIGSFGTKTVVFEANTGSTSIPIIEVKKTTSFQDGKWKDETDKKSEGIYKITYESSKSALGWFTSSDKGHIAVFIANRREAGNKLRIKIIANKKRELEQEKEQLLKEISELKKENQALLLYVENEKKLTLTSQQEKQEKIEQYKKEIIHFEELIEETNSSLKKIKETGTDLIKQFNVKKSKYKILVDIAKLLEFPSPLIRSFLKKYHKFLKNLTDYEKLFSVKENIENIIISAEITFFDEKHFNTKVITNRGTMFELTWLIKQFTDKNQPYCHKHDNGEIEEIRFSEWNPVKIGHESILPPQKTSLSDYNFLKTAKEIIIESTEELTNELEKLDNHKTKLQEELQKVEIKVRKINSELQKREKNKKEIGRHNNQSLDEKIEQNFEELKLGRIENDDQENKTNEPIMESRFN